MLAYLKYYFQKLSLNLQGSEEMSCSAFNPDLDALLTKFQSAIVAEINESDIVSAKFKVKLILIFHID